VRTRDRYPVEVLREWKAEREAEFDTATREALHRLGGLPTRLPDLLVEAFRDATAQLSATVDRLEAAGELTHDAAQLLHAAMAATGRSGPGVGDGVPDVKEAYDAAGGASFLGLPSEDAYEAGPGVVQHLRGARCGHPAVICAITGRPAVVITADLWNGIAHIGGGRPGGGVHGVGFPVHTSGGDHRYIGPTVERVPTAAGSWRAGTMRRTGDDRWTWIPDLAFDPNKRRQRRHRVQLAVGAGPAAAAGRADPVRPGGAAADRGGPTSPHRRAGQAGTDRDRGRPGRRPDRGATRFAMATAQ
jgi:hypothetical protein